jgi:hypothetical protein
MGSIDTAQVLFAWCNRWLNVLPALSCNIFVLFLISWKSSEKYDAVELKSKSGSVASESMFGRLTLSDLVVLQSLSSNRLIASPVLLRKSDKNTIDGRILSPIFERIDSWLCCTDDGSSWFGVSEIFNNSMKDPNKTITSKNTVDLAIVMQLIRVGIMTVQRCIRASSSSLSGCLCV